jgi:hypothetical protein
MVTAVDAVATFPAFTYGLLIAPRVSLCRGNIHALAQQLHLAIQVFRWELLATAYAEAGSIATTAS